MNYRLHNFPSLVRVSRAALLFAGLLVLSGALNGAARATAADPSWDSLQWAGFSKLDITPQEPVRLSGYAVRAGLHTAVADPLSVRVLALAPAADADQATLLLVSIDSIGVTSKLTTATANWVQQEYGISRAQLVLSSTHSHAAPHLAGGLTNLYSVPSTPEETAATARYTQQLEETIRQAIQLAMQARQPAELSIGAATVDFPTNRRLLRSGGWVGIGEHPEGQVDQQARVLCVRSPDGTLLGATMQVACHCTTMGGGFEQVSGDWAGLAASRLEQLHRSAIFLPVIGCGADANPSPRGSYELAQRHAANLVDAVQSVLANEQRTALKAFPQARFGYAGLVPEQPSQETINQRLASDNPNERNWAEQMIKIRQQMGRLPESYPMPIHTWRFGDALTWVFLGGEVVVDYQFRLERELTTDATWVAAYCDDVFAYVASEAMRAEGGYEVDSSMIYYLQPGRWESGTQALIVRRVREIWQQPQPEEIGLPAKQALRAIQVPADFRVELVASEPLVTDPVNLAFGFDGKVWVVEMNDYPLGVPGGGRVKWLRDNDGDGQLDEATVFLDQLSYPTSVFPWRDGVLIIAAPHILFAKDTTGDGVADYQEVLLSGIAEANPQHRASGFEWGLDGWLHLGCGHGTRELISARNGETYVVNGHDVAWQPDTGELRISGGETQFVRARDAFGNWFGNSNSLPMYQFVIPQRYREQQQISGSAEHHLLTPATAPPVLPASRTVDRFNDLFAAQRFTSACSATVARVPGILSGDGQLTEAFICEPVHNLVARFVLRPDGAVFSASRHADDTNVDFFASTDVWSRPVRVANAPDGTLWVLDMTRRVIEHPEWIPTAWQQSMDLRAGSQQGRIYRVSRRDFQPTTLGPFSDEAEHLLQMLASDNGVLRDLAGQRIVELNTTRRADQAGIASEEGAAAELAAAVRQLIDTAEHPAARASALGVLAATGWLTSNDLVSGLTQSDGRVVAGALRLAEALPQRSPQLDAAMLAVADRQLGPQVDLQWVLTIIGMPELDSAAALKQIAQRHAAEPWIGKSLTLVHGETQAWSVLSAILERLQTQSWEQVGNFSELVTPAQSLWRRSPASARLTHLESQLAIWQPASHPLRPADVLLLTLLATSPSEDAVSQRAESQQTELRQRMFEALQAITSPAAMRLALLQLVGSGLFAPEQRTTLIIHLLEDADPELRLAAIAASRRLRDAEIDQRMLSGWERFTLGERQQAAAALLSHQAGVLRLLAALEQGVIRKQTLDLVTIRQLRDNFDRVVRSRAIAVLGQPTPRSQVVQQFLAEMNSPPRKASDQGAQLFLQHCAVCHDATGGQPIGPVINNLAHWTNEQWVKAIMDPNETVEPKYHQASLLTHDGRVLVGMIESQDERTIQLATADGKHQTFPAAEIESVEPSLVSLMPEGFEEKLTPAQLAELIAYLRSRS
ncbi:neutral/alkaline non-lysosomal ceramidase N-terminal domain-containing protein [Planctomycetaceae bacterium SH139]